MTQGGCSVCTRVIKHLCFYLRLELSSLWILIVALFLDSHGYFHMIVFYAHVCLYFRVFFQKWWEYLSGMFQVL